MTWSHDPRIPPLSLQTPRLLLRPWRETDREEFLRVQEVSASFWRPWMPAATPGETGDQLFDRTLQLALRGMDAGTQLRLVAQLQCGRLAGFFSIAEIVRGVFQCGYAGWRVSADVAGQGLATEGVRGLLDLALAAPPRGLGLHRVQANIIPSNLASLRVAGKCGFRREGLAARYLKIANQWQDHVLFAKTVEEHASSYIDRRPPPAA
jgi:[ribosomal protein S5]-alanine N-acetyltransferase